MTIRYFADTDTLHIEFKDVPVVETRDLGIAAITVEYASERAFRSSLTK